MVTITSLLVLLVFLWLLLLRYYDSDCYCYSYNSNYYWRAWRLEPHEMVVFGCLDTACIFGWDDQHY